MLVCCIKAEKMSHRIEERNLELLGLPALENIPPSPWAELMLAWGEKLPLWTRGGACDRRCDPKLCMLSRRRLGSYEAFSLRASILFSCK